jgi:hypothetical protein
MFAKSGGLEKYESIGLFGLSPDPEVDGTSDNPDSAKSDFVYLRRKFPGKDFGILTDEVKITGVELDATSGHLTSRQ